MMCDSLSSKSTQRSSVTQLAQRKLYLGGPGLGGRAGTPGGRDAELGTGGRCGGPADLPGTDPPPARAEEEEEDEEVG